MSAIEEIELEKDRSEINIDVRELFGKYRKIFDWDVPDIDQRIADRLILSQFRNALRDLEEQLSI
jgi:hypothetical protein